MRESFTRWVRVLVTPTDKQVLRQIAEFKGSMSEAGAVRGLIRDEGRRLGILPSAPLAGEEDPQLEPAQ